MAYSANRNLKRTIYDATKSDSVVAYNRDLKDQFFGVETGRVNNTGNSRNRTYSQRKRTTCKDKRSRRISGWMKILNTDAVVSQLEHTNVIVQQDDAAMELDIEMLLNEFVDELMDRQMNADDYFESIETTDQLETSSLIDLTPAQHVDPAVADSDKIGSSGNNGNSSVTIIDLTPIDECHLAVDGTQTDGETSVAEQIVSEIDIPSSFTIDVQPEVNDSEGGNSWKSSLGMTPTKEDVECLLIKLLHMMDEAEVVAEQSPSSTTKPVEQPSQHSQCYHFPTHLKLKVETMTEAEEVDSADEGVTITVTTINVKKSALRCVHKSAMSVSISSEDMRMSHTSHLNLRFSFQDTSKQADDINENDIKALMGTVQQSKRERHPKRHPERHPEQNNRDEDFKVPAKKIKRRTAAPRVYAGKRRSLAHMCQASFTRPTKLPNFPEIHKRLFENMESLVDYVSRKAKRAKKLKSVSLKRRKKSATSVYGRKISAQNPATHPIKETTNRIKEKDCHNITIPPQPASNYRRASPTKRTVLKAKPSNSKLQNSKRVTPDCTTSPNKMTKMPKTFKKPATKAPPHPVKGSVVVPRSPQPRIPLVYGEDKFFPMAQRQTGNTGDGGGDAKPRNNFPPQFRKIWRP